MSPSSSPAIAIVGMACQYPDADSPQALWENVLAQRRAFRRMPPVRLDLDDYFSADPDAPDRTYATEVALIEGYTFDRTAFNISGETFRATDLAHWLALDVAARALDDAGFAKGAGLPKVATGVWVGNTLTGEFSRAQSLRLRWPYVRRQVAASLAEEGWETDRAATFLGQLEARYKSPFAPVGEETLAGGLSNTIAGRICNHFGLNGGGYTVDGACASSLLAVIHGCAALVGRDVDVAMAGGVDLSLDPFELVGFAKSKALASGEMRVYDARACGFWPGEGCGFVTLMRADDAAAHNRRIYAVIRGWGISSDGAGGITRPEADGQRLALRRAYARAGFGIETVGLFEGHGTGTPVGDTAELAALTAALREAGGRFPAVIGSIKANIGHTKAAAGVAGLIKATLAVHHRILPPATGVNVPHPILSEAVPALRLQSQGALWPDDLPLRAGVSAMGFGGINSHIVIESGSASSAAHGKMPRTATDNERSGFTAEAQKTQRETETSSLASLFCAAQDTELFVLAGKDAGDLMRQAEPLALRSVGLSRAEMADLSVALIHRLEAAQPLRAAVVAATPSALTDRLHRLVSWLKEGVTQRTDVSPGTSGGLFVGVGAHPRIGFLFPGQGAPVRLDGGALGRRFESVRAFYARAALPPMSDPLPTSGPINTAVAQPAIVATSAAALTVLRALGMEADVAVGHSLGEISALCWAGAMDEAALLRVAAVRGAAMAACAPGGMAGIGADRAEVEALLMGISAVIAGFNGPRQTVVSGSHTAVSEVVGRAEARGLRTVFLPVSHAFHSPHIAAAAPPLAAALEKEKWQPLQRCVASTITGALLDPDCDLRTLLLRQVTEPVRFTEAMAAMESCDLLIEVGPGETLCGLTGAISNRPAVSVDAGGDSLSGLLCAVGAAYALGAPIRLSALVEGRFVRPFDFDRERKFFANPCELAPPSASRDAPSCVAPREMPPKVTPDRTPLPPSDLHGDPSALELLRRLISERTELPLSAIGAQSRLLDDLHLNSITVSQIILQAARILSLPPPASPTFASRATVAQAAEMLEEMKKGDVHAMERIPPGVASWVRAFDVAWIERPLRPHPTSPSAGSWQVVAQPDDPLAEALRAKLTACKMGDGVAVSLAPAGGDARAPLIGLLLEGARRLAALRPSSSDAPRFVLIQQGEETWGAGFAKTLHLERPDVPTCVVNVPHSSLKDNLDVAQRIVDEAAAAVGYVEARYDADGRRCEPRLRLLPRWNATNLRLDGALPLEGATRDPVVDVLLVTGGGKGIAAECAFALAREQGVRLALLGRSCPDADPELARNLDRMAQAGVVLQYITADVTDPQAVGSAVRDITQTLGPVVGILHGAGVNTPTLIGELEEEAFLRTVAVKVRGAQNILASVDVGRLRLFVAFGSIIARTGLSGEADYAVANAQLAQITERLQTEAPHCRCLCIEWSVWSGIGMGERLGRIEALRHEGITPITPDAGIAMFRRLIGQRLPSVSVVVCGRFGNPPTLQVTGPELPLLRFLEKPRVHIPGVELVVDADLSPDTDPYLDDHLFRGERLLSAVIGLEAMSQVAMALAGGNTLRAATHDGGLNPRDPLICIFENVAWDRPVVIAKSATLRLAALVREEATRAPVINTAGFNSGKAALTGEAQLDSANSSSLLRDAAKPRLDGALPLEGATRAPVMDIVLRSSETAFQVDHFRATCRFGSADGGTLRALDDDRGDTPPQSRVEGKARLDSANASSLLRDAAKPRLDGALPLEGATRAPVINPLSPDQDLYGTLLFQKGRFRRLRGYRRLRATECIADIEGDRGADWFGGYLPQHLILGDPGARDATIHAIQACIPHAVILPVGVDRLTIHPVGTTGLRQIHARECAQEGDLFTYDVDVTDEAGVLVERWEGLKLRKVEDRPPQHWPAPLLGPYLSRRLREWMPDVDLAVRVASSSREGDRSEATEMAIQEALGENVFIVRRPDGKPEIAGNGHRAVSASHAGDLTLAVAGAGSVACDLEPVVERPAAAWRDLLGQERFRLAEIIAQEAGENRDAAATRVWCAIECLTKAGMGYDAPLCFVATAKDRWVRLAAGDAVIVSVLEWVKNRKEPLVIAILNGEVLCAPTNTVTSSGLKRPISSAMSIT